MMRSKNYGYHPDGNEGSRTQQKQRKGAHNLEHLAPEPQTGDRAFRIEVFLEQHRLTWDIATAPHSA